MLGRAADVVSVDLSDATEVRAWKLHSHPDRFGVQGNVTVLPFADQAFDLSSIANVSVITRDSDVAIGELVRVTAMNGLTGGLGACSCIPVIGRRLRMLDLAPFHALMPDFKTTWTNTFDFFWSNADQRHLARTAFRDVFPSARMAEEVFYERDVLVAERIGNGGRG